MKVVLLGTSGYHPTEKRETACVFLPEVGVVFDAGTAVYRIADRLCTDHLDIFLSHAHLDHIIGLTYLPGILPTKMLSRVTVYGEVDKLEAVKDHLFAELLFPVPPSFHCQPVNQGIEVEQGGKVRYFQLEHPGGSIGYRIDWPDRSIAYITDTIASVDAPYVDQLRDVNLLIHEAYYVAADPQLANQTGHSSVESAARVAAKAGARRLVLVHIGPDVEQPGAADLKTARTIFPSCEIGFDGMEIEF